MKFNRIQNLISRILSTDEVSGAKTIKESTNRLYANELLFEEEDIFPQIVDKDAFVKSDKTVKNTEDASTTPSETTTSTENTESTPNTTVTSTEDSESSPSTTTTETTGEEQSKELEKTLEDLAKSINDSTGIYSYFAEQNEKTITQEELTANLKKLAASTDQETAGIGQAILGVYEAQGVDIDDANKVSGALKSIVAPSYTDIVTDAIFRAIKGEEIDPESKSIDSFFVGQQTGITVEELMALDKDGDGSIVKELQTMLSNPEFLKTCQFMIDREKNHAQNNQKIDEIDSMGNNDGLISVGEIAAAFGSNDIADLFKNDDGTVDRALMVALGGTQTKDGNYTINAIHFQNKLYQMDADRDGIVTADEVAKYKEGYQYRLVSYDIMMSEMEKSNDKKNNFDGKFCLDDMEKFINNNETATESQKEFFSVITDIKDEKLKKYIMQSIGNGSTTITTEQFTETIDSDGNGIVTKEELEAYVDFATKFYNADKVKNTDRLLTKEESKNLEPFKSNPDIWYSFTLKDGCVKMEDVWEYLKTHQ